jgi:glycosyltransferase involved in cell wall biosynthesis
MTPRVLMLISNFYPVLAGAEQQALNLSRMLVSKGIPVSVLTRSIKNEKNFEQINGVKVYREIHVIDKGKWFGISYILSSFYFLFRKRHTYNIIHCHIANGLGYIAALLIKFLFNKKVIVKVALSGPKSDFKMLKKTRLNRICLKMLHNVDKVITICSWSKKEALNEDFPESKISFIPNGVNTDHFIPSPAAECSSNKITFLGRLNYQKGIDTLLLAFSSLVINKPELQLEITGEGPEKTNLLKMAEDLKITNKVIFHGENTDPYAFLLSSSVFVLPSRSEGLPNVLLEAMSCGLPVIASNVGGNLDLIQSGKNGILFEEGNYEQLSSAIETILDNKQLKEKLGKNARQAIVKDYSMEITVSKYIELYTSLLTLK